MIYILIYGRATWMKVQYSQLCLILKNQSNYCIAVQLSWSFHIALSPSSEFCLMLHRSAAEQPLNHFESAMDYCNGYLSEISVGLLVLLREKKASRYYRSTRKLTQFVWGPIKSSGMGSHVCFFLVVQSALQWQSLALRNCTHAAVGTDEVWHFWMRLIFKICLFCVYSTKRNSV